MVLLSYNPAIAVVVWSSRGTSRALTFQFALRFLRKFSWLSTPHRDIFGDTQLVSLWLHQSQAFCNQLSNVDGMENRSADGGASAQRGFRYQALCALAFYFRFPRAQVQLEGSEDFDLVVPGEAPVRYQAKGVANLSLSSIAKTYLPRVAGRLEDGDIEVLLLENEPGEELKGAWAGDQVYLNKVVQKMVTTEHYLDDKKNRWTPEKARKALQKVRYKVCPSGELHMELVQKMRDNNLTGEPEKTIDLFLSWLSHGSETSEVLEPGSLEDKLLTIGQYLVHLEDKKTELNRTVCPLTEDKLFIKNTSSLKEEFRAGVSARFEHVVNELDFRRESLQEELESAFLRNQMVVLRGLSGQGKSTLAYRFLLENSRKSLRFQVFPDTTNSSFFAIYNTLVGYVECFGHPVFCLLEVTPGDTTWVDFAAQLQSNALLRVLVCIRDEDWNRARFQGSFLPPYIIEMSFTKSEAEEVYSWLSNDGEKIAFPCFDDAWDAFGEKGPLLEFLYLLREGKTLRERLESQVLTLSVDQKKLLRQVCAADICGATLFPLRCWPAEQLQEIVPILEREHLVFRSEESLTGAHPVRSSIVSELLHDRFVTFEDTLLGVQAAVDDRGLENLLLHLFLNYPSRRSDALETLNRVVPDNWTKAAATLKAQLWLGIKIGLEMNADLLAEIWSEHNDATCYVLNTILDCGRLEQDAPELTEPFWSDAKPEKKRVFQSYVARWNHRRDMYEEARNWLRRCELSDISSPKSASDWDGLCWCIHWLRLLLPEQISKLDFDCPQSWPDELPLSLGVDVYCFVHLLRGTEETAVYHSSLLQRFRRETSAFSVEANRKGVLCRILIPKEDWRSSRISGEVLRYLRGLFPDADSYSIVDYGRSNSSQKCLGFARTEVPKYRLPQQRSVLMNVWMAGIIYRDYRADNWAGYARQVLEGRRLYLQVLEELNAAFQTHWTTKDLFGTFRSRVEESRFDAADRAYFGKLLPNCAIGDDYGRFHESLREDFAQSSNGEGPNGSSTATAQRYRDYLEVLRDYRWSFDWFRRQVLYALCIAAAKETYEGHPHPELAGRYQEFLTSLATYGHSERTFRLAWQNFSDLVERHQTFSNVFRSHFEALVDSESLFNLENEEVNQIQSLAANLLAFTQSPNRVLEDPDEVDSFRANLLVAVKKGIKAQLKSEKSIWEHIHSLRVLEALDDDGLCVLILQYELKNPMFAWLLGPAVLAILRRCVVPIPEEPSEYLPSFFWPRLGLIETYNGRLLEPTYYSISTRFRFEKHLVSRELLPLFERKLVPSTLEVSKHPPDWSRDLSQGRHLMEKWDTMILDLEDLCSANRIPEWDDDDELASEVITEWVAHTAKWASNTHQAFIDHLALFLVDMGTIFKTMDPLSAILDQTQAQRVQNALECFEACRRLGEQMIETIDRGSSGESLEFWSDWLGSLKGQRSKVELILGFWSQLVLDRVVV